MASDESVSGSDCFGENNAPSEMQNCAQIHSSLSSRCYKPYQDTEEDPFETLQKEALEHVLRCVDNGHDAVDLSSRGLREIRSETLELLKYLVLEKADPSAHVVCYEPFEPRLKLFLANNQLRSLPSNLYRLESLGFLSARRNQLQTLSPAVANLKNLSQLHLSMNSLQYLPYEILGLSGAQGDQLRVWAVANPFLQPEPPPSAKRLFVSESKACRATTRVSYLDNYGRPCKGSPAAPSMATHPHVSPAHNLPSEGFQRQLAREQTRAPSLFELALRSCSTFQPLRELTMFLPKDCPTSVSRAFEHMLETVASGGIRCSVCHRPYFVARTEWIEWWSGIQPHGADLLPLLRRGCSWRCAEPSTPIANGWEHCGWSSEER